MTEKMLPNGIKSLKPLIIKLQVVLIPTYAVAFLTEAMVYTMPMLAASTIVATNLYTSHQINRRVDDGDSGESEGLDGDTQGESNNGFIDLS